MEIGEEAEEDDEGPIHPNWLQVPHHITLSPLTPHNMRHMEA